MPPKAKIPFQTAEVSVQGFAQIFLNEVMELDRDRGKSPISDILVVKVVVVFLLVPFVKVVAIKSLVVKEVGTTNTEFQGASTQVFFNL